MGRLVVFLSEFEERDKGSETISHLCSHVECGTLHCQGGSASPLLPSQSTYSSHSRKVNGAEVQCKVTSMNGNGNNNNNNNNNNNIK